MNNVERGNAWRAAGKPWFDVSREHLTIAEWPHKNRWRTIWIALTHRDPVSGPGDSLLWGRIVPPLVMLAAVLWLAMPVIREAMEPDLPTRYQAKIVRLRFAVEAARDRLAECEQRKPE